MFITGVGPVRSHQPRIRDKREGETFTSAILPRYLRLAPHRHSLARPLPEGYLHRRHDARTESTPPSPHPRPLRHKHRPLEESLGDGVREWTKRDLSGKRHVWADGIHFNVRLKEVERNRQCLLILIGASENGEIFVSCFHDSQPIPFETRLPISSFTGNRPWCVSHLTRLRCDLYRDRTQGGLSVSIIRTK